MAFAKDNKKTTTKDFVENITIEWKEHPIRESISVGGAFFTGILLHEGFHALAIKACGKDVTEFRAYPNRDSLGYVGWKGNTSRDQRAFISIAPSIGQFGTLNALLKLQESPRFKPPKVLNSYVKYVTVLSYLDFPLHSIECYWRDKNDIARFSKETGCPKEVLTALGGLQLFLYYPSIKSLWEDKPIKEPAVRIEFNGQTIMLTKTLHF